jgi:hypothetical protein
VNQSQAVRRLKHDRSYLEGLAAFVGRELSKWEELDARFGFLKTAPTGTVIRFIRQYEIDGNMYSFAALKIVGGMWYLTKKTNSSVPSPLSYDELCVFLESVNQVEWAGEWRDVETGEVVPNDE